jgi:hypothetical protein
MEIPTLLGILLSLKMLSTNTSKNLRLMVATEYPFHKDVAAD